MASKRKFAKFGSSKWDWFPESEEEKQIIFDAFLTSNKAEGSIILRTTPYVIAIGTISSLEDVRLDTTKDENSLVIYEQNPKYRVLTYIPFVPLQDAEIILKGDEEAAAEKYFWGLDIKWKQHNVSYTLSFILYQGIEDVNAKLAELF